MCEAIQAAHEAIVAQPAGDDPDLDGPLTTIVAAIVLDRQVTVGWVGDSRAYLISESGERQLTVDDSWMERVVAAGQYTREEAAKNRLAHAVTQVLGVRDEDDALEIHTTTAEMAAGETLLLCTDGLWNYFQEPGTLAAELRGFAMNRPAGELTAHLASQACSRGGHDNVTVAVLSSGEAMP